MKKKVLFLLIFMFTLMSGQTRAASARIYINDFSVKAGEVIDLKVMVEADVYVTQAQFFLELPDGFEFVNKGTERRPSYAGNTANSTDLACTANLVDHQLRVFLSDGAQIGTVEMSGELAVVYIKAKDDVNAGEYVIKLTNIVASDENAASLTTPDTDVKVTVEAEQSYIVSVGVNNVEYGSASISPAQDVYVAGANITATATAKEGYQFVKWTDGTNDMSTANPYITEVTSDMTLTAVFAPKQYTMTFVFDNGQANVVKTQDYQSDLTAPEAPSKTGFTFKGWNPTVPATVPASDQTFTAQWERNTYKLTFVVDGESTVTDVAYDAAITKPADPVKEGYTFTGWDAEIPATMPASDQTFTAQWERNTYKLTFVVDGESTVTDVAYEAAITKPADPVKEGYTFTGWDAEIPATMPASDLTFTAVFEVNSGISQLMDNDRKVDVYTASGLLIGRNMTSAQVKNLPRGTYILRTTAGKRNVLKVILN